MRRDSRVSASYTSDSFALIVHGVAREVSATDPVYQDYAAHVRDLYIDLHGPEWAGWYEKNRTEIEGGYFGWIEARRMFIKS